MVCLTMEILICFKYQLPANHATAVICRVFHNFFVIFMYIYGYPVIPCQFLRYHAMVKMPMRQQHCHWFICIFIHIIYQSSCIIPRINDQRFFCLTVTCYIAICPHYSDLKLFY